jgi:hypothetical protein
MVAKIDALALPRLPPFRIELQRSWRRSSKRRRFSQRGLLRGNTGGDKVDALRKRASEIKAALEAVQAKQRRQEKADDRRIKALIGEAMVADVEGASAAEQSGRKAYISEVLARNTVAEPARAFLKVKGWL